MYKLVEGAERTDNMKRKMNLRRRVHRVVYQPEFCVVICDGEGGVITIMALESLPTELVDKLVDLFRRLMYELDEEVDSVSLHLSREMFKESKDVVIFPQGENEYDVIIA